MTAGNVSRMKFTTITKLFMACTLAGAFAGCATSDGSTWNNDPTPSTDDCIIRCNAAGTGWQLVTDCGWAQNFPFSASCLNSQPHPVCQNN
jgi:hypothetical protein